ncbi:PDZ and LIM domain protein Zasp [Chionoecetes opilio]|uniref:PDZ and LIM domain protein Zasp n=1 Tax=Chionoecetes opilio TaxID=41210 RepID=A0A8J4XQU2_CHIOP|nr:PDZ and LIM domain protein Zasp [Chionoecetes opilio]
MTPPNLLILPSPPPPLGGERHGEIVHDAGMVLKARQGGKLYRCVRGSVGQCAASILTTTALPFPNHPSNYPVVFQVNGGSLAAVAGLQAGDAIVSIGGRDALLLRHKEAQEAIVRAGHNFDLVIQRPLCLYHYYSPTPQHTSPITIHHTVSIHHTSTIPPSASSRTRFHPPIEAGGTVCPITHRTKGKGSILYTGRARSGVTREGVGRGDGRTWVVGGRSREFMRHNYLTTSAANFHYGRNASSFWGTQVWRPQVTPLAQVKTTPEGVSVATSTSLAAN